ncbi:MAG: 2-amino-4-hydroxy-6-hydroxymethyldihydropteridine diphosphokinase [Myxococcales bacterium]|nr:2-amino-4-hydroxy-6-hydroxymethyldihydropteridine diphosphokinase [Myxococcales bacterium]
MDGRIYLGLGGNLGDRLATLRAAVEELERLGHVVARSSVWETEPVGPPPDYLNAVVALDLAGEHRPEAILDELLAIEARHGRVRPTARDAPRSLDLDLLLWDERVITTDRLSVPHPRLHQRQFVLEPLAEVAPDLVHPLLHRTIAGLLADLPRQRRVRRRPEPL